jgi:hypothetical protein
MTLWIATYAAAAAAFYIYLMRSAKQDPSDSQPKPAARAPKRMPKRQNLRETSHVEEPVGAGRPR